MDLNEQLRIAVAQEDYESAAVLRDLIEDIHRDCAAPHTTSQSTDDYIRYHFAGLCTEMHQRIDEIRIKIDQQRSDTDAMRLYDLISINHDKVQKLLAKRSMGINPIQIYKVIDTKEMSLAFMFIDKTILKIHYHDKGFKVG